MQTKQYEKLKDILREMFQMDPGGSRLRYLPYYERQAR